MQASAWWLEFTICNSAFVVIFLSTKLRPLHIQNLFCKHWCEIHYLILLGSFAACSGLYWINVRIFFSNCCSTLCIILRQLSLALIELLASAKWFKRRSIYYYFLFLHIATTYIVTSVTRYNSKFSLPVTTASIILMQMSKSSRKSQLSAQLWP